MGKHAINSRNFDTKLTVQKRCSAIIYIHQTRAYIYNQNNYISTYPSPTTTHLIACIFHNRRHVQLLVLAGNQRQWAGR